MLMYFGASLVAQRLKRLPPMRETRVRSLGQEDPLEKEMVTHLSILAWRIPDGEAWLATVHGVTKSQTRLSDFTYLLKAEEMSLNINLLWVSPVIPVMLIINY